MSIQLANHPPHGTGATAQLYEEVRRVTRDEALAIVIDAAGNWANELTEYIAPASEQFDDEESAESQRDASDEIWDAIEILRGRDYGCA
jgi:hypothetical protein